MSIMGYCAAPCSGQSAISGGTDAHQKTKYLQKSWMGPVTPFLPHLNWTCPRPALVYRVKAALLLPSSAPALLLPTLNIFTTFSVCRAADLGLTVSWRESACYPLAHAAPTSSTAVIFQLSDRVVSSFSISSPVERSFPFHEHSTGF